MLPPSQAPANLVLYLFLGSEVQARPLALTSTWLRHGEQRVLHGSVFLLIVPRTCPQLRKVPRLLSKNLNDALESSVTEQETHSG